MSSNLSVSLAFQPSLRVIPGVRLNLVLPRYSG